MVRNVHVKSYFENWNFKVEKISENNIGNKGNKK